MIKKLILNICLVIIVVFILDFAIGKTLEHFYFKESSGLHYRTTYSIEKTKADILIFGSSRANHHYVPEVFEDSIKMTFYNTGRDGNSVLYNYAVYLGVIKRYNPQIMILDINPDDICYSTDSYDRLSSLLPYYMNHTEMRHIIELRSPFEKVKLFSKIYPYNSLLLTIGIGNLEINKSRKGDNKGYIPLYHQINEPAPYPMEKLNLPVDPNKLNALVSIAESCKTRNIRFIMIQSPVYAIVSKTKTHHIIDSLAGRLNFEFWDYANDSVFLKSPGYFQDRGHLNNDGAVLFSKIVANRMLKQNLGGKK